MSLSPTTKSCAARHQAPPRGTARATTTRPTMGSHDRAATSAIGATTTHENKTATSRGRGKGEGKRGKEDVDLFVAAVLAAAALPATISGGGEAREC